MPSGQPWNVEITDRYEDWFRTLDKSTQDAVLADVELLEQAGPSLGRPYVDSIKGSRHSNMKELRTMHGRRHLRTFFAFDPRRVGILLLGGRKGDKKWYKAAVAAADRIYQRYLEELKAEGLI